MKLTTIDFLKHHIRHTPDAPATSDGNVKRSWKELGDRVARLAFGLVSAGLKPATALRFSP